MIKEIRCQFEDVKEFQRFILNDKEYIKVPSPNMPFKIKVIKGHGGWQSEEYENFSPNAYNLKRKQYAEIGLKEECIVYPRAESEDNTRPHYSNVWTPEDSLYVQQGMLYD